MTTGATTLMIERPVLKPIDVRLAVPEDRDGLVRLTDMLHGENGLFSLSPRKRDGLLDRYYRREAAIMGVIGDVGEPVATIYLSISQPEYTDDFALVETWNFVAPEHRRTTYARQLIAYAKAMSDSLKLPLCIGILSNHRTEAKVRHVRQRYECVPADGSKTHTFSLDSRRRPNASSSGNSSRTSRSSKPSSR